MPIDLSSHPQNNPSFVLKKPNSVAYEDRPVPTITNEHDVLIRVAYTGICGSDVHYWAHGAIGAFVVKAPMVLGHESSGVIHSVGSSVTHLSPGDRVAMEPGIPCRRCARCKAGAYNLCPHTRFAATPPIDGTLARYYVLPGDFVYKLPEHVSLEEGALIEPLAVAVHIVRLGDVKPGQNVVVYGAGPVGLLCIAVARAYGAAKVVAVDVNDTRLAFAREYAATHTFQAGKGETPEQGAARLRDECGLGSGADVAIDASGAEVCIQAAVHVACPGGRYVQGGMGKSEVVFPIMAAMAKELDVKVSFRYKQGDYDTAIALVAGGQVNVKRLISDKVRFEEAERAFVDTKAAKGIKVLIEGPST